MLNAKFFVSAQVHAREVMLPDGSVHTLHFKEVPHTEFRRFKLAEESRDEKERLRCVAQLIAASLCTEAGKSVLTVEKAATLSTAGANALMTAVMSVNAPTKEEVSGKP